MSVAFGEVIAKICPAKSPIETIACTSDSQKLIVGQVATGEATPTLSIVDINTGNIDKVIEKSDDFDHSIWRLVIDKKDNYIVYLKQEKSNYQIIQYNLKTEAKNLMMEVENDEIYKGFVISPQNQMVMGLENKIIFYDIETNKVINSIQLDEAKTIHSPSCFTSLGFSPDGNLMVVGGLTKGEVLLYDLQKGDVIQRLSAEFNYPSKIVFDPTGNYLFILDYRAKGMFIWNRQTKSWHMEDVFGERYCYITCLDFDKHHPQNLVIGSLYFEVEILDFEKNERLFSDEIHQGRVYDVFFTPDGKKLISPGEDWQIVVRNAE